MGYCNQFTRGNKKTQIGKRGNAWDKQVSVGDLISKIADKLKSGKRSLVNVEELRRRSDRIREYYRKNKIALIGKEMNRKKRSIHALRNILRVYLAKKVQTSGTPTVTNSLNFDHSASSETEDGGGGGSSSPGDPGSDPEDPAPLAAPHCDDGRYSKVVHVSVPLQKILSKLGNSKRIERIKANVKKSKKLSVPA